MRPSGDLIDLYIRIVAQAYKDAVENNGHSATARAFLMDDEWAAILDISPETIKRIRDSIPELTP